MQTQKEDQAMQKVKHESTPNKNLSKRTNAAIDLQNFA